MQAAASAGSGSRLCDNPVHALAGLDIDASLHCCSSPLQSSWLVFTFSEFSLVIKKRL